MNQRFPTIVRLQMSGEFDLLNKDELADALLSGDSADCVIINMTDTTYIDSSALRCLIDLRRRLVKHGGALELVGLSRNVRRVFTITGLDDLFEISDLPAES